MSGWVHVVLVGTSVLRNLASRGFPELGEVARDPFARAPPGVEGRLREMVLMVEGDPRGLSAELNALHPYLDSGTVSRVVLLYTDTDGGRLAARILEEYLRPRVRVDSVRVHGLGRVFELGVLELADVLSRIVEEARREGLRVAVNLTGGFKTEACYALLASALLGVEKAYYVYEASRSVVELPLPPLRVDPEALKALELASRGLVEAVKELGVHVLEDLKERGLLGEKYEPRPWVKTYLKLVGKS